MPFILDEDKALKQKLQGMYVVNYADDEQIPVNVFFRFPDQEEVTRTFPHLAIDLVEINFDRTRAHRANHYVIPQVIQKATPNGKFDLVPYDFPLPWSLVYQIAIYSRDPRHDRQLTGNLYQMFPQDFGFLEMAVIDGTIRRADLVSVIRRDTVDNTQKRLYRNIFTIAVSAEFFLGKAKWIQQNTSVAVDFSFQVNQVL